MLQAQLRGTIVYRWKKKFGGKEVSKTKRLRELERENREPRKIVAEQTPDVRMLKDVNSKKWSACQRVDAA